MGSAGSLTTKDEFRNTTPGWVGVTLINGRGEANGFPVAPGDTVWLGEDEQISTANAPKLDVDNPFANGALELITRGVEVKNKRPWGSHAGAPPTPVEDEETGATPPPAGEPEEGVLAPGEEVATPEAPEAAGRLDIPARRGPGRPRKVPV